MNLNLLAAFSGSLFSRSKKTTERKVDGSERAHEEQDIAARGSGQGAGSLSAFGEGNAGTRTREVKVKEVAQGQGQRRVKAVDHLGIE